MTTNKVKPVKQPVKNTDKKQARKKRKYNRKPTMHHPVEPIQTDAKKETVKVKEVSNVDLLTKKQVTKEVEPEPVQKKGFFRRFLDFFSLK